MVNDKVGPYFVTRKGLRQGDPFSPLLFNVAADVLATLVSRAQEQGFIKGLIPEMYDGGLTLLQYADDTIFVFEDNLEYARNLKIILCTFEHLTGLKINFSKSEVYCFGSAVEKQDEYAYIFTCKARVVPFRYLGMPLARGPDQSVNLGRAQGRMWCLFRGPTISFSLLFFYFFEFVLVSLHSYTRCKT
jgi:hypothetical protein